MANIIGYNIYVDGAKYNSNPLRTFRHVVTGLTNGVEYDFVIKAVDEFGNETAGSAIVSETPEGSVTNIDSATLVYTYSMPYPLRAIAFNSNGSKMITLENGSPSRIHSYDLSMAYYIQDNPAITDTFVLPDSAIRMCFSDDGYRLFTIGNSLRIYSLSAPFDITTMTQIDELTDFTRSYKIAFSPYGYKMFAIPFGDSANQRIFEYDLPAPWAVEHRILRTSISLNANRLLQDITIASNGSRIYVTGMEGSFHDGIIEVVLSTPYSLGDGHTVSDWKLLSTRPPHKRAVAFSRSNDKMFLASRDDIREYNL